MSVVRLLERRITPSLIGVAVTKPKPINYGQFGQNFIEMVVTADRINEALGAAMEIPAMDIQVAPGNLARVKMIGSSSVTDVKNVPSKLPQVWFQATATMGFDLVLEVVGTEQRYKGTLNVAIRMHVRTFDPLTIFLEIPKVTAKDVEATLEAENVPAELWKGLIEDQLPSRAVEAINEQLESSGVVKSRTIDVLALVASSTDPGSQKKKDKVSGAPLKPGGKAEGTVESGEEKIITLDLSDVEDSVEFFLYAKLGGECDEGIYAYLQVLDVEDGEVGSFRTGANSISTFDVFSQTFFPSLHESEGGRYKLRITCEDGYKVPVLFKIVLK